jgi:hypothetical protein
VLAGLVVPATLFGGACAGGGGDEPGGVGEQQPVATSLPLAPCPATVEVIVYVNPATDEAARDALRRGLQEVDGVVEVTLEPDDVSPAFRVTLDDPGRIEGVRDAATSLDGAGQVVVPDGSIDVEPTC